MRIPGLLLAASLSLSGCEQKHGQQIESVHGYKFTVDCDSTRSACRGQIMRLAQDNNVCFALEEVVKVLPDSQDGLSPAQYFQKKDQRAESTSGNPLMDFRAPDDDLWCGENENSAGIREI